MTAQLSLDDHWLPGHRPPRARRTDGDASHRAADQAEASGLIGRQMREALEAVKRYPGLTSKALAQLTGLERHMLGRRLPDLLRRALVLRRDGPEGWRWWSGF